MVVAAGDMLSRGWPLLLALPLSPLLLNQLIRRRSDWLLRRQRLLNALPLIGSLIGGQQLSLIFTILALTQSAGISFLQGLQSVEESLSCPLWRQRLAQARALIVAGGADLAGVKPLRRFYTAVPAAHPHGESAERWIRCWKTWRITIASKPISEPIVWLRILNR